MVATRSHLPVMTTLSLFHLVRQPAPGANVAADKPPLLLLLHGVGSNERHMASIAPAFDPRLVVLAVRSPIALGPDAYAWFHVQFTPAGPVINEAEARAGWTHLAAFIDEAVAAYRADPSRVYIGGFSQGAIMSLAVLLTSPSRIAGALAMSGRLLPELLPFAVSPEQVRDRSLLLLHGVDDQKLGIDYAPSARRVLETYPIALTYRELAMGHEVSAESLTVAADWLSAELDRR
jgi:phospholipase/carboxylesterase